VQVVPPQMPPGQSQHHFQSQFNNLYPLQQQSEVIQEAQNLTSSATSYFQQFQAIQTVKYSHRDLFFKHCVTVESESSNCN
jgi:hypothetical protein